MPRPARELLPAPVTDPKVRCRSRHGRDTPSTPEQAGIPSGIPHPLEVRRPGADSDVGPALCPESGADSLGHQPQGPVSGAHHPHIAEPLRLDRRHG